MIPRASHSRLLHGGKQVASRWAGIYILTERISHADWHYERFDISARLDELMTRSPHTETDWEKILHGQHIVHELEMRLYRLVPSNPRCKLCGVPFGGTGGRIFRFFGRKPWSKNPTMCNVCQSYLERHRGGAETDLTMLFADVRGSTTIAEGMTPTEYTELLNKFFKTATDVLVRHDAWIDKFVGDEIVAFFFPVAVSGKGHARTGLEAARDLLRATHRNSLPIGIGVHTGRAYVGTVGGEVVSDVTAIGDDVNVAARLASVADGGTIVATETTCVAAGLPEEVSTRRELSLKGKSGTVLVRILGK